MTAQDGLAVGPVREEETSAVVALWEACGLTRPWNDPWHDLAQARDGATSTVLVARDAAGVAGSVMVGFDGHRGWMYYLAVAEQHRGAGLGARLVRAAETWLADLGCRKVELMVREGNTVTEFYQALGYERQQVTTYARWLTE
ncbi:GNAT family acetyltransferase [Georgenia alba]|uniref:GNAT family acetyltransferase n=1 Tax=Georgenia alba TaxID=2233858 RepID=A0ABW2QCP8_9MICO